MTEWNQALTAAMAELPEFGQIDADDAKLAIVALMHDETPEGTAKRNLGRTAKWDGNNGRIVGMRTNPGRKDRLCYLIAGCFGTVEKPVESVEVV